ncbi:unnamed protein product [marine sediment metagenome]|uniref:Uncharacterized protein n=1 Tax=marine sediment metagenome TaxID=412755 RepID=X1NVR5_9ZZZZ
MVKWEAFKTQVKGDALTDFKVFVKKKLKERYSGDPRLKDAVLLVSKVFKWNEEGQKTIEAGLKSEVKIIVGSVKDDLKTLQLKLEEI